MSVLWPVKITMPVLVRLLLVMLMMKTNASYFTQPGQLPVCPSTPNCVSSQATDKKHAIVPFSFTGDAEKAWQVLISTVKSLPRSKITKETNAYLRLQVTSLVFRFVDDVEFILDSGKNVIHVRSASRVGYGDFGVNRRRVETLRKQFLQNLKFALERSSAE